MKTKTLTQLFALVLLCCAALPKLKAQTFTTLHSFTGASDGNSPTVAGIVPETTLYGTARYGGVNGTGAIFAVNKDGSGFRTLYSFSYSGSSDGKNPQSSLVVAGNVIYGTAEFGGSSGYGTVFKVSADGNGFTVLHNFAGGTDGSEPLAGLALSGNSLYGTASASGASAGGAVFKVNTDGTAFQALHDFPAQVTNSDGRDLEAGLVLSGNTLYGTAQSGGSSGNGTVFEVNTDGTGFLVLHDFTGENPSTGTNSDGAEPYAGLALSGNTLYGTAQYAGAFDNGTIFRLNTDGSDFTNLYNFKGGSDGAQPFASLSISGNTLFGTAYQGGSGYGTVFTINTDGTGFTVLHSFAYADGAYPVAGLILSGNTLSGTTTYGGSSGNGAVFAIQSDGAGFTNLYNFTGYSDGSYPAGGVVSPEDTLYGWTSVGGISGNGTIFLAATNGSSFTTVTNLSGPMIFSGNIFYGVQQIVSNGVIAGDMIFKANTDGSGFTPLYTNNGTLGGLILSSNTLYGTTEGFYGTTNSGSIFAVNTDGTDFEVLHAFSVFTNSARTNPDGANPWPIANLVLSSDTLYGTAEYGGSSGAGTVFSINTDGTGFNVLHNFAYTDGANPQAGLILSGRTLYGEASSYGPNANGVGFPGTVFAINTDGTGFQILHNFSALGQDETPTNDIIVDTNFDGEGPQNGLVLSGSTLYGVAYQGGTSGNGTVFAINTNGTSFAVLHEFSAFPNGINTTNADGANPSGLALGSDGVLYGSAQSGGSYPGGIYGNGAGTLFRITWPPQITAQPSNTAAVFGGAATFTVTAAGGGTLIYQWQQNGTNLVDGDGIGGSQTSVLTITSASSGDAGGYDVVVSSAFGSVTSAVAVLNVGALVVLPSENISIAAPNDVLNIEGVLATNVPGTTFAWSYDNTVNEPESVSISDPANSDTSVTFNFAGTYVLTLTATDGTNVLQTQVTVNVGADPNGTFQNISNFLNGPLSTAQNVFLQDAYNSSANDAENYYAAIDPNSQKTTLSDWEIANGIPTNPPPVASTNFMGGVVTATYFNSGDLGFGRRMIMLGTNGGDWAYAVINYASLQDAINDTNRVLTEAMDYSTIPGDQYPFAKFYLFDSTGARISSADLDGSGYDKTIPGLCEVCHGGLTGSISPGEAQLHSHFQPFDLHSLAYACNSNSTRAAQEPAFKLLNEGVLNIEQDIEANDSAFFSPAIPELIQGWYGPNLNNAVQNENFVPAGWQDTNSAIVLSLAGQSSLYQNVVAPSCRSCHITRDDSVRFGSVPLDFRAFTNFNTLKGVVSADVFGNSIVLQQRNPLVYSLNPNSSPNGANSMPQAKATFQQFWNSLSPEPEPNILLGYLDGYLGSEVPGFTGHAANETVLVSNTARFTVSGTGATPLSYQWQFYSNGNWEDVTDGQFVSGSQSNVLTLYDVQTNEGGNYQCVVSNAWGTSSSLVSLFAGVSAGIGQQPASETLPLGDKAQFNVLATGSLPLYYQWYFNTNTLLPDGTNASLAIRPAIANNNGYYQVVVSNLFGNATSDVASLTVLVEPNMWGISNNPSSGATTLSLASYPGSTNYIYATTNLALPLSRWQLIATNVSSSDGLFQFVDSNVKGMPAKYYRLVGMPLNLLADSSFETQSSWILFNGAQYSENYAHSGSWSMLNAAFDGVPGCYQQFPASPGMKFEMTGYGFTPAQLTGGTAYGILQITYFDSNNNNLGTFETSPGNALTSQEINSNTSAGVWTFLDTGVATAPPNTAYIQAFTLYVGFTGTDEGVYFDDLSLVQLN